MASAKNMPHWPKLALLAIAAVVLSTLCGFAHAKTIAITKDTVTSLPKANSGDAGSNNEHLNLDNISEPSKAASSAVQDWSLVCQQLCGAALGGAVCPPQCKNMPAMPRVTQVQNSKILLDMKKDLICFDLCELQSGNDVCTCDNGSNNGTLHSDPRMAIACAVVCDRGNVTLTDCAPCEPCSKGNNTSKETTSLTYKMDDVDDEVATHDPAAVADDNGGSDTTPNWNELCASLCKTGDGGSLCNCDLSPFSHV